MDIWFLILSLILIFLVFMFCRRWHDYALCISFAIGFAVNAHFYHSFSFPSYIQGCPIPFGFNAFLYVGFMFAAVITALEYTVRRSKILTSSTCAAILMAAGIQWLANISIHGFNWPDTAVLIFFVISAIGSFVAVWTVAVLFRKMQAKKIGVYPSIISCVLLGSFIHAIFFFGGAALVYNQNWEAYWWNLLGYVIEIFLALGLGLLMFWLNTNVWIPKDLQGKYQKIWTRNK